MSNPFAESHHQFFSRLVSKLGGIDGGNMLGGGGGRLLKSISLEWGMGSGSLMGSLLGATGFGILTTFFGGVETLGRGDGFGAQLSAALRGSQHQLRRRTGTAGRGRLGGN